MNRGSLDAILLQLFGEPIRAVFGAREDEHLRPVPILNEMGQQRALLILRDRIHKLLHRIDGGIAPSNLDLHRIVQQALRQPPDVI